MVCPRENKLNLKGRRKKDWRVRSETTIIRSSKVKNEQIETKSFLTPSNSSIFHIPPLRREVTLQDSSDFARVFPACKHVRHLKNWLQIIHENPRFRRFAPCEHRAFDRRYMYTSHREFKRKKRLI